MKFQILLVMCIFLASSAVSQDLGDVATIKQVLGAVGVGIRAVKGVAGQKLECYHCINYDKNGRCAQGDAAKQCEVRSLLRRFGSFLRAKFIGRPTVVPVCLRAEIQVGNKLMTRHSCAMVNEKDDLLDKNTCTSSLYMLGGVSGNVEVCELCTTNKCNTHRSPTPSVQPGMWYPYVQPSALVRNMDLGNVMYNMQTVQYNMQDRQYNTQHTNNASALMASLSLLITCIVIFGIN